MVADSWERRKRWVGHGGLEPGEEGCAGIAHLLLEGAILPGAGAVAGTDLLERNFLDRDRGQEKAGGIPDEAEFGEEFVVGLEQGMLAVCAVGTVAGGGDAGYLMDVASLSDALERAQKRGAWANAVHGFGGELHLVGIAAVCALQSRDEEDFRDTGLDNPSGNDGEGKREEDFAVDFEVQRKFALFVAGPGAAHAEGETVVVFVDLMERHIPMQHLAQHAVGEQGVQALVVVQEACGALRNGEALGEVLQSEVFDREFRVVLHRVNEGGQVEQAAHAAVGLNVSEGLLDDAGNGKSGPGIAGRRKARALRGQIGWDRR